MATNNFVNSNDYTPDSYSNYTNAYNHQISRGASASEAHSIASGLLEKKTAATPPASNTTPTNNTGTKKGNTNTNTTPTNNTTTTNQGTEDKGTTTTNNNSSGKLAPLSDDYYQQTSEKALSTIKENLNRYRQSNPEYFSDYDSFKQNFSYDRRNQEQKNVLDTWYKGYEKGLQLSATPVSDLYTQYNDGLISLNDLENLRISNPTKYNQLQAQINKGNIVAAYDDDKTTANPIDQLKEAYFNSMLTSLTSAGDTGSKVFADYEEKMNSAEMTDLSDKCTELEEQARNIQDQISSMTKDVEKEYEGTGATKSKINAIVADRTYELQQQLRTINNEYEKYATQYNNRMQQYQQEFTMKLQEHQINMQERNMKMQELGFALDLMNFETNDQKQEREWNYWVKQQQYQNGDINSKDYSTRYKAALKSVQNLLAQYDGIPMVRSSEQMAQDILKAIDNGSDLGTELTKLNKQIQQKPEYKQLYNNTFGVGNGIGKTFKIGDTEYIEYNDKLYTAKEFNQKFGGKAKDYTQVSEDVFNLDGGDGTIGGFFSQTKNMIGNWGGQCGKYVNDYLEYIGVTSGSNRYYDNDLSTKLNSVNSDTPKVGSIAVFDYNHKSDDGINHGHVGIVTHVFKDGSFIVHESNRDGNEVIGYKKIMPGDSALQGFFDPSLPSGGTSSLSSSSDLSSIVKDKDGNLTEASLTQLATNLLNKTQTYSELESLYGKDGIAKIGEKALELQANGFERDTKITDPTRLASQEGKAKQDYEKSIEDAQQVLDFVSQMETAWSLIDEAPGAAQQALIQMYNKILDPKSIVREGEYNRTAEGQDLMSELWGKIENMTKGGTGVTKEELEKYMKVARELGNNANSKIKSEAQRAKVMIDKYGLTPEYVLGLDMASQLYDNVNGAEQDFFSMYAGTAPTNGVITLSDGKNFTWEND